MYKSTMAWLHMYCMSMYSTHVLYNTVHIYSTVVTHATICIIHILSMIPDVPTELLLTLLVPSGDHCCDAGRTLPPLRLLLLPQLLVMVVHLLQGVHLDWVPSCSLPLAVDLHM